MTTDFFGKPADLCAKRLWLLDMDGTIYCENGIFPGTLDFLREIRTRGGRYVFITNNSSKSVTDYLKKVSGMGIPATYEDFYTSSQATARFLTRHYPGAKVYCQGTRSLIRELQDSGIDVTVEVEPVDVVLLGFDLELTSEKLRRTCQILTEQKQAAYYATNPDLVCPVSFGYVPDCGSMSIMIRNATGREPIFIGKPEPTMIRIAMENLGYSPEQTIVVGDRVYTDIASGVRAGVDTIGVLSGEASLADYRASDTPPTYVFRDVREIFEAMRK